MDRSIQFKFSEKAKKDLLFLHLVFEGGDATTQHPKYFQIEGVTKEDLVGPDKNENAVKQVNAFLNDYSNLKKALKLYHTDSYGYDKVKEQFGDTVASLYDNTPQDPENDFQDKCTLSSAELIAYDSEGNSFVAHINL